MTLHETRTELDRLKDLSPRTKVVILRDTKYGRVRIEIGDIRFDGGSVVVVEATPSW